MSKEIKKIKLPFGVDYIGETYQGKPSGHGTLTFLNGCMYKGNFKNGKRHGKGIMYFSDGRKISGIWKDGALIK